jgi:hypothetical protein
MQPDMDAGCEIRAVGGQGPSRSGVMRPGLRAPGLDPRPTTDDRRVPSGGERDCARRHPDPVALELGWEKVKMGPWADERRLPSRRPREMELGEIGGRLAERGEAPPDLNHRKGREGHGPVGDG